ncbi:chorismate-binding protein [Nocardia sp. R7R-8]|uniref:chorismate-binding protein n=1 Tax=Nocardia sp. R7R-8 TaxID=3459304 RepID=UPI00403DBDE5
MIVSNVEEAVIATGVDPASAYRALYADAANSFWLDGNGTRTSYLGTGVPMLLGPPVASALRVALRRMRTPTAPRELGLGLVGWLGYEVGRETTGVPVAQHPGGPARMLRVYEALAVDPDGTARLLVPAGRHTAAGLRARGEQLTAALATELSPLASRPRGPVIARWRDTPEAYLGMIEQCQAAIAAGEAYQLCLTTQVSARVDLDPVAAYLAVRETSGTARGGLIRIGGTSLLSTSPEQFLHVGADRVVSTSPIKGTRPRGADHAADTALRTELRANEKERAENVMIVDLMRNDLARVCELGSVRVTRLLEVESYPHVHQLVSTVQGRLRDEVGLPELLAATFPAGSMTGAPKIRAMQLLDGLESGARGAYAGAFGFLGADGTADLAMTIRTIVYSQGIAQIGTGGGITALSNPAEELDEIRLKAHALLTAIGAAEPAPVPVGLNPL